MRRSSSSGNLQMSAASAGSASSTLISYWQFWTLWEAKQELKLQLRGSSEGLDLWREQQNEQDRRVGMFVGLLRPAPGFFSFIRTFISGRMEKSCLTEHVLGWASDKSTETMYFEENVTGHPVEKLQTNGAFSGWMEIRLCAIWFNKTVLPGCKWFSC